jgi:hypothetical protein
MTAATYGGDLVECPFGWLDVIAYTNDPWRCWLSALPARHLRGHGPLDAWIEHDVDELIQRADRLRLSIVPETKRFTDMWAAFRRHHENLEDRNKYRRRRYLTWRAAALTLICQRDCFQDVIDRSMARDKLAATMREFGPLAPDGSYGGSNFWRAATVQFAGGATGPDPLSEYAAMVLLITKRSIGEGK